MLSRSQPPRRSNVCQHGRSPDYSASPKTPRCTVTVSSDLGWHANLWVSDEWRLRQSSQPSASQRRDTTFSPPADSRRALGSGCVGHRGALVWGREDIFNKWQSECSAQHLGSLISINREKKMTAEMKVWTNRYRIHVSDKTEIQRLDLWESLQIANFKRNSKQIFFFVACQSPQEHCSEKTTYDNAFKANQSAFSARGVLLVHEATLDRQNHHEAGCDTQGLCITAPANASWGKVKCKMWNPRPRLIKRPVLQHPRLFYNFSFPWSSSVLKARSFPASHSTHMLDGTTQ